MMNNKHQRKFKKGVHKNTCMLREWTKNACLAEGKQCGWNSWVAESKEVEEKMDVDKSFIEKKIR